MRKGNNPQGMHPAHRCSTRPPGASNGRRRAGAAAAILALASIALLCLPATAGAARGDFNGDGYADLAVGVPNDTVTSRVFGSRYQAGCVHVIYGSAAGLVSDGNQRKTQNSSGILDLSEEKDHFGFALAAGDFNGDGFSDLAVGVPDEDIGGAADAGGVNVIYGSATGLVSAGNQFLTQDTPSIAYGNSAPGLALPPPEVPEAGDRFGYALAAGDNNNDGYDDLAIGAPGENGGDGYFVIVYGSAGGLGETIGTARGQAYHYLYNPYPRAGSALALGDLNGDGPDELIVGMPAGNIVYVYPHPWDPGITTISGWGPADGELGYSVATGDFDHDGKQELAMGAPAHKIDGVTPDTGGFRVCHWPIASGPDCYDLALPSLAEGDRFGSSMATGDINGDGYDDLAIGAPGDTIGRKTAAGSAYVIFGSAAGPAGPFVKWYQDKRFVADESEARDKFGASLCIRDFNGDGHGDMAVGVPGEAITTSPKISRVGMVQVFTGRDAGLKALNSSRWYQGVNGITGSGRSNDKFGFSLGN